MAKSARMEGEISARVITHRPNPWDRTTIRGLVGGSGTVPGNG